MIEAIALLGAISTSAAIAKAAWVAVETIHRFVQEARKVDEIVQELELEVSSLANTCMVVRNQLQQIRAHYPQGSDSNIAIDEELGNCVNAQLTRCRDAIDQLAAEISVFREPSSNWLDKARKKIGLDQSQDDRAVMKDRIHSHNRAMQTLLIMVNIQVSHLAPRQVGTGLSKKLDMLNANLNKIQQTMSLNRDATRGLGVNLQSDPAFLDYARKVMSNGQAFYASTVVNGSHDNQPDDNLLDDEVLAWIEQLRISRVQALDGIRRSHDARHPPGESSQGPFRSSALPSAPSPVRDEPLARSLIPCNEASGGPMVASQGPEDDINLGLTERNTDTCRRHFEARRWYDAQVALADTLALINDLSAGDQQQFHVGELECMFAICTYYTQPPDYARAALIPITQRHGRSDVESKLIYTADILLALLYLQSDDLERARALGESAVQGRSNLLGRHHDDFFEAIALMATIAGAQGRLARAESYYSMIPSEKRSMYKVRFSDISWEEGASAIYLQPHQWRPRASSEHSTARARLSMSIEADARVSTGTSSRPRTPVSGSSARKLHRYMSPSPGANGTEAGSIVPFHPSPGSTSPSIPPVVHRERTYRLYISKIMLQGLSSTRRFQRLVTLVALEVDNQERRHNSGSLLNCRKPVWIDPFEVDSTLTFTVYDIERLVTPFNWRGTVTIRVGEVLDFDADTSVTINRYLWTGPYRSSAMITVVLAPGDEF